MIATRLVKIAMVASTALFALLVAYDNLVDYGTNYEFVRHTLSMDTTSPNNRLMSRAITSPAIWTAGYCGIILAEAATGLLLATGAAQLAREIRAPAARFQAAKKYALIGVGLGFMLWFTGFMVIGSATITASCVMCDTPCFAMWRERASRSRSPQASCQAQTVAGP